MNIKKIVKIIVGVIIFLIITLMILYFINSKNYAKNYEVDFLKEKISQEIYFLDDYIISIGNSLNNINLENYIIKAETLSGQSSNEDNNSDSNSSGKSSEGGSNSSKSKEENATAYIMEPSDVLVNARKPDWESVKISVERLYFTWATIAIDLYKLNIDSQLVQNFSRDIDELTKTVKVEDKSKALGYISKLYDYLPIFGESAFINSLNKNMISTKANIVKVYSLIDTENWDEMRSYLGKAENEYMNIINNDHNKNQYNVNKGYVLLKEFQISLDTRNTDVVYIKYKNLLDELNVIDI